MIRYKSFGITLIILSFLLHLSCKSDEIKSSKEHEDNKREVKQVSIPLHERIALNKEVKNNPDEIIVRAKFSANGKLINVQNYITHEIYYLKNKMVKDVTTSKSGRYNMKVTQEYDDEQRMIKLISEQNGKQEVVQWDKYSNDGLLLSEMRLERNETSFDTILYEYHYPDIRSNPLKYYRTNNGEKVTDITLTKSGRTEILVERADRENNYVSIISKTRLLNSQGKVVEERQSNINSDWNSDKFDTTFYEPIKFEYDDHGRITRKESQNFFDVNGTVNFKYTEEGILEKKIIVKKGYPEKVINYRKVN